MPDPFSPIVALGLMSGTSADGVDAALVRTDGDSHFEFLGATCLSYESDLRRSLLDAAQQDVPLVELLRLENAVTEKHVLASRLLLDRMQIEMSDVGVVGFHGHTIRHVPQHGLTWQLGNPALLAAALKTCIVSDFRRLDMAAGGQGAPLAPLFHRQLFAACEPPTAVVNIGGVANLTWIGTNNEIIAGDTGPGCGLLDIWTQTKFGLNFDRDGRLAAEGHVSPTVLQECLRRPFFDAPFPKSADRYDFDFALENGLDPHDGLATLCALTANTIAIGVEQMPVAPKQTFITGGGAANPLLMSMLSERLKNVQSVAAHHCRSDSLEAECFAWLAVRRMRELPTALPSTTGCGYPTSGGVITHAPRETNL